MKLLVVVFLSISSTAYAARVRVVGSSSPHEPRLRAELASAGFEVCRDACSDSAVAVVVEHGEVVATMAGQPSVRMTLQDANDVVRFVEAVRAEMLPLLPPATPSSPPVPEPAKKTSVPVEMKAPPSSAAAPVPDNTATHVTNKPPTNAKVKGIAHPQLELAVLPTLVRQGGSTAFDLGLRARFFPWERFGFGVFGAAPVVAASYAGDEGQARARAWVFGGEGCVRIWDDRVFRLTTSLGLIAARISVTGEAKEPYTSSSGSKWSMVPFLSVEATPRITSHWSVPLSALLGFSVPPTDVRFAGRTVDSWGAPVLRISLGAQYEF